MNPAHVAQYDATMGVFKNRIGSALRRLRVRAGLTQVEFAAADHRGQGYLSLIENGRKLPNADLIDSYLELTHSNPYDLVDALCEDGASPEQIAQQIVQVCRIHRLPPAVQQQAHEKVLALAWELMELRSADASDADPDG